MPLRSPKMNRFIFGFHRRVWCPKWTPASSSCFMVTTGAMGRTPSPAVPEVRRHALRRTTAGGDDGDESMVGRDLPAECECSDGPGASDGPIAPDPESSRGRGERPGPVVDPEGGAGDGVAQCPLGHPV